MYTFELFTQSSTYKLIGSVISIITQVNSDLKQFLHSFQAQVKNNVRKIDQA